MLTVAKKIEIVHKISCIAVNRKDYNYLPETTTQEPPSLKKLQFLISHYCGFNINFSRQSFCYCIHRDAILFFESRARSR